LQESFNNINAWQKALKKINVPRAEFIAVEGGEAAPRRGGSAAGNLLWLAQSIMNTYSRTRELINVLTFFRILLIIERAYD
jgi:hypothetical protein